MPFRDDAHRLYTPFWYAVFRGNLDGTQYAKGRYTQYAESLLYRTQTSIFTLKRSNFHQKHNTHDIQSQITLKKIARSLRSRFLGSFLNLNMDFRIWEGQNLGNLTSKHIKPYVFKNYCTCAYNISSCNLTSLCKWERSKWLFLLLNGTQYARPKNGGTQYAMRN